MNYRTRELAAAGAKFLANDTGRVRYVQRDRIARGWDVVDNVSIPDDAFAVYPDDVEFAEQERAAFKKIGFNSDW